MAETDASTDAASAAICSTCSRANPPAARYCSGCGAVVGGQHQHRGYAVAPNESVASFALVSTVMPYASAQSARTYKLALLIGIAIPILSVLFGQPSFALVTAAVLVPVVFILYLYDVNLWEDQPIPVVIATIILSAAFGVGLTLLLQAPVFADLIGFASGTPGTFNLWAFLIPCVIAPVVGVILMLIGPLVLASRPAFDDLMDGLTFGIVSGVSFAAATTLTVNWTIIGSSSNAPQAVSFWLPVIVNAALLTPIVFGCAVGIAAAEFSGLGEGYDGFTGRFLARVVEAMVLLILFEGGLYFTGLVGGTTGLILGLLWALVITGLAILRMRTVLQRALLEGALEAAAREQSSKWASGPDDFCAECEMPLLVDALFCISCGASVRARARNLRPTAPGTTTTADPAPPGAGEGGSS